MSRRACHGRGEGEAEGNGEVGAPLVLLSLYEALLERAVCGLLKVGRAHQVLHVRGRCQRTRTAGTWAVSFDVGSWHDFFGTI